MENNNPYQTPNLSEAAPSSPIHLHSPRRVKAGNGITWIGNGYHLFQEAPLLWVGLILIWLVINGLALTVPLSSNLIQPILLAGICSACLKLESHQNGSIEDLFAGFKRQTGSLILLGAISVAASLLIVAITFLLGLSSLLSIAELSQEAIHSGQAKPQIMALLTSLLIAISIMTPVAMALWYSPLLVFFHQIPTLTAMKLSFIACYKNVLPFLVYGLAALPLLLLAALPAFLGYLILLPIFFSSIYVSYKDIFLNEE